MFYYVPCQAVRSAHRPSRGTAETSRRGPELISGSFFSCGFDGTAVGPMGNGLFGERIGLSRPLGFEDDTDPGVEDLGYAPQHAQGMALVTGRFDAADLLLGGFKSASEVALRKSGLLAQRGKLHSHVPGFAGPLETGGEGRIFHLLFEVAIEIRLFHAPFRFSQ